MELRKAKWQISSMLLSLFAIPFGSAPTRSLEVYKDYVSLILNM
jgi:hypothetical protein